jgi:hypothetical protein
MVVIARAMEPVANLWAGILENEGIKSMVMTRDPRTRHFSPTSGSLYGLYVLESQADKAKEVLAPFIESQ